METLLFYLVKSCGLLAAFYLAYVLLLRRETFFEGNRWFLLAGLFTSVLLPLVSFTKIVWVDPTPVAWADVPMTFPQLAAPAPTPGFEIDWFLVALWIYAIGIFVFLVRFMGDFNSLAKTLKGQTVLRQSDFKLVDVPHNVSPFSYFNYIVYNSSLYTETELANILEHEKVHCEQKHSADVLIARLFCIVFWFNPIAWLYKKAMLQNLEFIADQGALRNLSDKKAYQFTLLKVTAHDHCVEITNHFYQSLIKKRIVMLNKNQSKKWQSWKYVLIVPVLAAFLFYFQVKVIAQERQGIETGDVAAAIEDIVVNKNTSDAELKAYSEKFKQQYGVKLKFSKVKRNKSGEITSIKAQYSDKNGQAGTWQMQGDEPINPMRLSRKDDGKIAFGSAKTVKVVTRAIDKDSVAGEESDDESNFSYSYSYDTDKDGRGRMFVNGEEIEMPEMPELPEMPEDVFVKTFRDKNGKVTVTVNGETSEVDPAKIIADMDIEEIKEQAMKGADEARRQMEKMRPQMDRAKRQAMEAKRHAEDARRDAEDRRQDSEDARADVEDTRRELEETRREMEQTRREIEQMRRELAQQKVEAKAQKSSAKKK